MALFRCASAERCPGHYGRLCCRRARSAGTGPKRKRTELLSSVQFDGAAVSEMCIKMPDTLSFSQGDRGPGELFLSTYLSIYLYIYIALVFIYICIYIYVYIYVCICMYMYICIYIYICV